MCKSFNVLFKSYNIGYTDLVNKLSENPLLIDVIDNGEINDNSMVDFIYKDDNIQLYSYTVNFKDDKYLFYEKINIINCDNGKIKHGDYKSFEIFQLI